MEGTNPEQLKRLNLMAQEVFSKLVNTPYKREVVLAEGTHMIAVEKNRMELIKEVQRFLDEKR